MPLSKLRELARSPEFQRLLRNFAEARYALDHVYSAWARDGNLPPEAESTVLGFAKRYGDSAALIVLLGPYLQLVPSQGHRAYLEGTLSGKTGAFQRLRILLGKDPLGRSRPGAELVRIMAQVDLAADPLETRPLEDRILKLRPALDRKIERKARQLLGIAQNRPLEGPERRRAREMIANAPVFRLPIHLMDLIEPYDRFKVENGRGPTLEELLRNPKLDPDRVRRNYAALERFMEGRDVPKPPPKARAPRGRGRARP